MRKANKQFSRIAGLVLTAVLVSWGAQMAQSQGKQTTRSATENSKTPATGCSLLTPALLEKILGQPFKDVSGGAKMPPAYNGAWGSICEYAATRTRAKVDFLVFVEASPGEAKQFFDKTTMFYIDNSKPKLSVGDSAYWDTNDRPEPAIHVLRGKVHFKIAMIPVNEKQLIDLAAAVAAGI